MKNAKRVDDIENPDIIIWTGIEAFPCIIPASDRAKARFVGMPEGADAVWGGAISAEEFLSSLPNGWGVIVTNHDEYIPSCVALVQMEVCVMN